MRNANTPSQRAFQLLYVAFIAAPIIAGLDKFANILVDWTIYLSPIVSSNMDGRLFMKIIGIIEIAAGILTVFNPRLAGLILAGWMWAIILNLLTIPGYYDIALRDFGLSLGALALSQLAEEKKF